MNKMTTKPLLFLLLAWPALFATAGAINCKGCTPLDELTFDKMIRSFPVSLVKFDTAYPYGDKHEEFAKVAKDGAELKDLFVGEVGIKDYGERDNEELGKRYKIEKDDFPGVMLFKNPGDGKEVEEIQFAESEFTAESLKNFLRVHTGIYLPLAGCLEAFDLMADKMLKEEPSKWAKLAEEAEAEAKKEKEEKNRRRADLYVKIMKKMAAEGEEFAKKETARTKKMVEGKITEAKKAELQEKLNILRSFTRAEPPKDEL